MWRLHIVAVMILFILDDQFTVLNKNDNEGPVQTFVIQTGGLRLIRERWLI